MVLLILLFFLPLSASIESERARMEAYLAEIPHLAKSSYPQEQRKLLRAAEKATALLKTRPLSSFPRAAGRENIYFLEEIGVFKCEATRDPEILTWELACLFGIEEAFTPAIPLTLEGIEGELQLYCPNTLTKAQSYDERIYPHVSYDSFAKCALGVLLFALRDMHNENCAYSFLPEGKLKMRFFDTLIAFSQERFYAEETGSFYPYLSTPFHWIGWDFPQAARPSKERLKPLLKSWPGRLEALKRYLNHPLTPFSLSREQQEALTKRALTLSKIAEASPKQWLAALRPDISAIEKTLNHFIPHNKPHWLLFRLQWNPSMVYGMMSEEDQALFREWILGFRREEASAQSPT